VVEEVEVVVWVVGAFSWVRRMYQCTVFVLYVPDCPSTVYLEKVQVRGVVPSPPRRRRRRRADCFPIVSFEKWF
jgi:hypothetical protein